jgi:hypothetical protein
LISVSKSTYSTGFLKKSKYSANDHIKLHMTVANAKYAERKNSAANKKGQQDWGSSSMDVRTVLEVKMNFIIFSK